MTIARSIYRKPACLYHSLSNKAPHELIGMMEDSKAATLAGLMMHSHLAYHLLHSFELNQLAGLVTISAEVDKRTGYITTRFDSRDKDRHIEWFPMAWHLDNSMS